VGIAGKWFPTGAHKVGAAYGCLVPRLVSGNFDPTTQKAVWPSTGNYCRGGAYDCALLGAPAVAILPEGMSRERFEWLKEIGTDEIIATPGTESNVKEIYDKCWELRRTRGDKAVIFNQFEEFGNAIWHYTMTGGIIEEIFQREFAPAGGRLSGFVSATGSAGTIAAGDFLRTRHPGLRVVATEALQCPTLYQFGFGAHRIEGIGDKHIPWIHNVRNTDMVAAIDDEQTMQFMRLFNEPAGRDHLQEPGRVGRGGGAARPGRHFLHLQPGGGDEGREVLRHGWEGCDLLPDDRLDGTVRVARCRRWPTSTGAYTREKAIAHAARYLHGTQTDHLRELSYFDRKALHQFKYFTWVEQQGKTSERAQPAVERGFLAGRVRARAGRRMGPPDRAVQRRHRAAEKALSATPSPRAIITVLGISKGGPARNASHVSLRA
jgi:cysteine synthase A